MLPLYEQNTIPWNELFSDANTAHSGLLFDKFPDGWDERNYYKPADNAKKQFLERINNSYKTETAAPLSINLANALNRQRALVNHLQGESLIASTDWRFVSGLGAAHPYETGFIWHRTLSVPYLPGSSVKGMMRAWATHWGGLTEQQEITRLFGTEKTKDEAPHCGALLVFDALPSKPPELEIDILNPHYSEYYQDSSKPPADYLSPKPVFFLTVAPGQSFEFFIAPRKEVYLKQPETTNHSPKEDLKIAEQLLSDALVCLGAGGKTAVGYGQMTSVKHKEQEQAKKAKQWLDETIEALKIDKDLKGQPEENLWKKPLSEKWLRADKELKPLIVELIRNKWKEFNISWEQSVNGKNSAEVAKRNFTK